MENLMKRIILSIFLLLIGSQSYCAAGRIASFACKLAIDCAAFLQTERLLLDNLIIQEVAFNRGDELHQELPDLSDKEIKFITDKLAEHGIDATKYVFKKSPTRDFMSGKQTVVLNTKCGDTNLEDYIDDRTFRPLTEEVNNILAGACHEIGHHETNVYQINMAACVMSLAAYVVSLYYRPHLFLVSGKKIITQLPKALIFDASFLGINHLVMRALSRHMEYKADDFTPNDISMLCAAKACFIKHNNKLNEDIKKKGWWINGKKIPSLSFLFQAYKNCKWRGLLATHPAPLDRIARMQKRLDPLLEKRDYQYEIQRLENQKNQANLAAELARQAIQEQEE